MTSTVFATGTVIEAPWLNDVNSATYNGTAVYTPAGTGAVATNVQAKLRQYVSVKDFGAVGDGTTDDTTAVQAAITAGGSIYFPVGNYKITSVLTIPTNIPLRLFGAGKSVSTITQSSATSNCLQYLGASYLSCDISDMSFVGGSTSGAGLYFTKVYNSIWQNLSASGGGAGVSIQACFSTQFNYISANSTNSHGFSIVGENTITFLNCYATSVPNTGGFAGYNLGGKATLISCNSLNSGGTCVNITGTTANMTFIGCNFEDFLNYGIYSTAGNLELILDNCTFLPPTAVVQPSGYQCSLWIDYSASPIIIRGTSMLSKGASRVLATEIFVNSSDAGLQLVIYGPETGETPITVAGVSHTAPYWTTTLTQYQNFAATINNLSATKLWLTALSTYANNAAAIAGGLNAGSVYRTSTGQLQVVY
jgi:hypothetical protein